MAPADVFPSTPAFVEVTGVAVSAASASHPLLIEVERPDGARLRVHAAASLPLAAVPRAFLDSPGCCN